MVILQQYTQVEIS